MSSQPRVPAGSPAGGQFGSTGGSNAVATNSPAIDGSGVKKYKGMDVDRELDPTVLDKLNKIAPISVISTCAGHPPGAHGVGAGPGDRPGFNFNLEHGPASERQAETYAAALRKHPNTEVETSYWRGQYGQLATHVDGKPRRDVFSQKEIDEYPTSRASVRIKFNRKWTETSIEERLAWWNSVVDATAAVK